MNFRRKSFTLILLCFGSMPLMASVRPSMLKNVAVDQATPALVSPKLEFAQTATPTLPKVDGGLARISKMASTLDSSTALNTLRNLNPAARFRASAPHAMPEVMIDAIADGDVPTLEQSLARLGFEETAVFSNDIGGWLPVDQIEAAAALPELRQARAPHARTRSGAATSQGDYAQYSDTVRALGTGFDGSGVTVGVLSDSFNCYAYYETDKSVSASGYEGYAQNGFVVDFSNDVSTGDLPSSVDVVEEADCGDYNQPYQLPFTDEGRAILQIVHDVAPGASLAFSTAGTSDADFATQILAVAKAGAKVIDDDEGFTDEPFFQDGVIAQAVDQVEANGAAYFSSAGNDGRTSYENSAPVFSVAAASNAANAGEKLLNFDPTGQTTTTVLPITLPEIVPGEYVAIVVEWDQPYVSGAPGSPGASSSLDVCLTDNSGNILQCSGANTVGTDAYIETDYFNPANSGGDYAAMSAGIMIGLASGSAPGLVKLALLDDGAGTTINAFQTNSPTLQGHPGAAGAAAVGAAFFSETPRCGTTPATLETYSSGGGDPILFDTSGVRLATPVVRNKPDFVAADGVSDTFLGDPIGVLKTSIPQCGNSTTLPNFFGTSAAAPHAASVAALFLQAQPSLTPTQIYAALSNTAQSMNDGNGFSYDSGTGFIQADAAFNALGLTAPVVASAPTSSPSKGGSFASIDIVLLGLGVVFRRRRASRSKP